MSLDIFKVKVKYCVYGMIWGTVGSFFLHSFWFITFCWNLSEIMDFIIITTEILLACIGIAKIKEHIKDIKKYRYWQQPEYCVMFALGIALSIGIYITALCPFIQNSLNAVPKEALKIIFLSFPLTIICSMIVVRSRKCEIEQKNTVLLDYEIIDSCDDKFFGDQVDKFIDEFDRYSGPWVFGIEGPWGVGKTSFANLCCNRLEDIYHDKIVIYKFNPLNYEDSSDVLKNFYTGLIAKIREEHFVPEIEALLDSYMDKVIASVSAQQSFFKFDYKFFNSSKSDEYIIKKLDRALAVCEYDIVVVIDDLDRLDFLTIKKIFFLMRNIFCFKNLKFILCYDIENVVWSAKARLNAEIIDEEKIIEFMDKYINESCHLYLKPQKIKEYIQQLSNNVKKTHQVRLTFWTICINGIIRIFDKKEFAYYQKFLTTPRRVKKLLQQLVRISNANWYENSRYDFNGSDLINLLLIYIYYPSNFKSLWYAETGEQRENYSCSTDRNYEKQKKKINDKIKNFSDESQFLFRKIFCDQHIITNATNTLMLQRACFNSPTFHSTEGALERYLQCIVLAEVPSEDELYSKYITIIKEELLGVSDEEDVIILFEKYQKESIKLWDAIVDYEDSSIVNNKFSLNLLKSLILVAIEQLENYKLPFKITSFHTKLIIYIRMFLEQLAVKYKTVHYDKQIANYIFEDSGVLYCFLHRQSKEMTLIYIFDVLYFRGLLDIRVSGNDSVYQINEILIHHENANQSIPGNTNDMAKIALRKISQYIYYFFKRELGEQNIWAAFAKLPLEQICEYSSEDEKQMCLFALKLFILNQIGSPIEGMACYDLEGDADNCGVRKDFSQYLVSYCFDIDTLGDEACFDFIEFMLISMIGYDSFGAVNILHNLQSNSNIKPLTQEILTYIMDLKTLKEYWGTYRDTIIHSPVFDGKKLYINREHVIEASYIRNLVVQSLDEMVKKKETHSL